MIPAIGLAARSVFERTDLRPAAAVILGSGFGRFADLIQAPTEIPYSLIPGWPVPSTAGHTGSLLIGELDARPLAVLRGRVHLYEGFSPREVAFPVRALGRMGVETLVLTNAAGAVNPEYRPGQLALIRDHINLQGASPLAGPNDAALGPRFPDMTDAYSARLRELAQQAAEKQGARLAEGVYAAVPGPNYETPAEIRFLRAIGADLVGMSTALEVIAARHMGIAVLGLSCVTNMAAGLSAKELSHEGVLETGLAASHAVAGLLREFLRLV